MTIDTNFAEFQHLADHLRFDECRRLIAALHFGDYEEPNALDQAERRIPKDIPCLNALLHWNSASGEGRGETHEILQHRLRQIGRFDLADWLGRTVFRQLGEDVKRSLDGSFKKFSTEKAHNVTLPETSFQGFPDPTEWTAFDTFGYIAAIFLMIAIVFFMCTTFCKKTEKREDGRVEYDALQDSSDDESVTLYDCNEIDSCRIKFNGV